MLERDEFPIAVYRERKASLYCHCYLLPRNDFQITLLFPCCLSLYRRHHHHHHHHHHQQQQQQQQQKHHHQQQWQQQCFYFTFKNFSFSPAMIAYMSGTTNVYVETATLLMNGDALAYGNRLRTRRFMCQAHTYLRAFYANEVPIDSKDHVVSLTAPETPDESFDHCLRTTRWIRFVLLRMRSITDSKTVHEYIPAWHIISK
uniref:Uncharacterized protein n=1 Tax=Vespula pensylvanica TaxID=30213 RepID=A0A834P4A3_VESPE|nr:hypothetical protein H0235_007189 [Vespula pensylvanica]